MIFKIEKLCSCAKKYRKNHAFSEFENMRKHIFVDKMCKNFENSTKFHGKIVVFQNRKIYILSRKILKKLNRKIYVLSRKILKKPCIFRIWKHAKHIFLSSKYIKTPKISWNFIVKLSIFKIEKIVDFQNRKNCVPARKISKKTKIYRIWKHAETRFLSTKYIENFKISSRNRWFSKSKNCVLSWKTIEKTMHFRNLKTCGNACFVDKMHKNFENFTKFHGETVDLQNKKIAFFREKILKKTFIFGIKKHAETRILSTKYIENFTKFHREIINL